MKTLRDAKVGETVKVVKLHGEGAVKRRIMDMGITKGVEVYVRKLAPLGDPVRLSAIFSIHRQWRLTTGVFVSTTMTSGAKSTIARSKSPSSISRAMPSRKRTSCPAFFSIVAAVAGTTGKMYVGRENHWNWRFCVRSATPLALLRGG